MISRTYKQWEWHIIRFFTGTMFFYTFRLAEIRTLTDMPSPLGIAQYISLTWLSHPIVWLCMKGLMIVALTTYILGVQLHVFLGVIVIGGILTNTFYDSQGAVTNTNQVIFLIFLAQWLVSLYMWGIQRRLKYSIQRLRPICRQMMIQMSQLMIMSVYVNAGITKLRVSGLWWIIESPLVGLQIYKSRLKEYLNTGDIQLLELGRSLSNLIIEHPTWVQCLFAGVLLLECGAFLFLWNRVSKAIAGVVWIAFHVGTQVIFGWTFVELIGVHIIYMINLPYWVWFLKNKRKKEGTYA